MKRTILLGYLTVAASVAIAAGEFGTRAEAEAMVHKAVKHVTSVGKDKAIADFNEKKADWVDRDLYIVMLDSSGKVLAHSTNAKLVGKEMIEVADADGRFFTREMVDVVKSSGKGWVDYKFTDPATKKVLPKSSYCEKAADAGVCVGVYRR